MVPSTTSALVTSTDDVTSALVVLVAVAADLLYALADRGVRAA